MVTNPTMLVRFFGGLVDGDIVSAAHFALMLTPVWDGYHKDGSRYGLGVFLYGDGSFGHGGLWPGYRTHVVHDPVSGVTVAVQTNRDGRLDMHGLAARIRGVANESNELNDAGRRDPRGALVRATGRASAVSTYRDQV